MKELSIEEKAKRFDKGIEKLRNLHDNYDTISTLIDIKEELENIFPELKVSDSEKIRNFISNELACLRATDEKGTVRYNELTEAIAWLEAHEEQVNLPHFTFDDVLALQCAMGAAKKVQKDEDLYKQLESLHDRVHDAYWIEKQGEQKPAWSEKDDINCKRLLYFLNGGNLMQDHKIELFIWMESLKERMQPQPKQEWSEKDEENFARVDYACLKVYGGDSYSSDWLRKFLGIHKKWKPSEGQLECLGYAIDKAEKDWSPLTNNRIYLTLKALKEQLLELIGSKV